MFVKNQAMRKLIMTFMLAIGFAGILEAQTEPGFAKAKKDLMSHKSKLSYFLSEYNFSSVDGFDIQQKEGPFKKYSYEANNSLYKYIWTPDLLVYHFTAVAPKTAEGDEYTFTFTVSYSRSSFKNGYGELQNNYNFYAVGGAVQSYKGKALSKAALEKALFEDTKAHPGSMNFNISHDLVKVDSIVFEKNEDFKAVGYSKTLQEYFMTVYGVAVKEAGDYEYSEIANVKAQYSMTVDLKNGKWVTSMIRKQGSPELSGAYVNKNFPPVNFTKDVGVEETYKKYSLVKELPIESYRYIMDLCRLIESQYVNERDVFINVAMLRKLFQGEEGKLALDRIYQMKKIIDKYHLTVKKMEVKNNYGGVSKDKPGMIQVYFSLERNLSKEDVKILKSKGVDKSVLNVIKYPAKGTLYTYIDIQNDGKQLSVKSSSMVSELKMQDGSRHPKE